MSYFRSLVTVSERPLSTDACLRRDFVWYIIARASLTFSVISLSQESILSLNRSSVLPLLLLKLLLWKSCLQDQKDNYFADEAGGERVWVLS